MSQRKKIRAFFIVSFAIWLVVMGSLYYVHSLKERDQDLGYATAKVELDSSKTQYFSIIFLMINGSGTALKHGLDVTTICTAQRKMSSK